MPRLLWILLLLWVSGAGAETLRCPFDVGGDGDTLPWVREGALNRPPLLAALREALALTDQDTPWTEEIEVSPGGTQPNVLHTTIAAWPTLPVALREAIAAAGCQVMVTRAGEPARVPRVEQGQLTYDADDPTRPLIVAAPLQATGRPGRWWLAGPGPRAAWAALGPNPINTTVIDTFNRPDVDPIDGTGVWVTDGGAASVWENTTNQLRRGTTGAAAVVCTTGLVGGPNAEYHLTLTGGDGSNDKYLGIVAHDSTFYDGYACRIQAAADLLAVYRVDDVVYTLRGSPVAADVDNGDTVMVRFVGNTTSCLYNHGGAGWVQAASETEATYAGAATRQFCFQANTGDTFDDLRGGKLLTSRTAPIGRYFLGR